MFLKLYVSKDCTDDKLFTKPIANYSYKIKTIKTGDIYVLYINLTQSTLFQSN